MTADLALIPEGSTDLVVIATESLDLVAMFKGNNGEVDPVIARIEKMVRAHAPDLTTDKGRKAIASLSRKVSTSKVWLDEQGKALTEVQQAEINLVNAARKKIRDRLDLLRDEARKPLTDWEAAEDAREARIKETMSKLRNHGMTGMEAPWDIHNAAMRIKAIVIGDGFGAAFDLATSTKEASLAGLRTMYAAALQRDKDAAELAELRAQAEARDEADRVRAEQEAARWVADRVAADAARVAKEQAERDEAERVAAHRRATERATQIEADKLAAVEAAKLAAEQAAARQRDDDAARHLRELADAKAATEAAAQAERDRIAAQAKAEADARAKREADATHRANICAAIRDALAQYQYCNDVPGSIAEALIEGRIPHCKVSM